jgi:hypothetical protein
MEFKGCLILYSIITKIEMLNIVIGYFGLLFFGTGLLDFEA